MVATRSCMEWLNAYEIETPEKNTIDIDRGIYNGIYQKG